MNTTNEEDKFPTRFIWEIYEDPFGGDEDEEPTGLFGHGHINSLAGLPYEGPITKHWNLWILHCPYRITNQLSDFIGSIPGVDTFNKIGAHRCIMAFSKSFYPQINENNPEERTVATLDLRTSIVNEIKKFMTDKKNNKSGEIGEKIKKQLDDRLKTIGYHLEQNLSKYKYWAYAVFPNEQTACYYSNNKEDIASAAEIAKEAMQGINGLFKSNF